MQIKNYRFTHYMVTVLPINNRGDGPRARPVFVYVGYSVPKQPVEGLTSTAISSTEIKLSWRTWPADAEPIAGFRVRSVAFLWPPPTLNWGTWLLCSTLNYVSYNLMPTLLQT
jgi:hypothetical protein